MDDISARVLRLERLVLSITCALDQLVPLSNFLLPSTGKALLAIRDELDKIKETGT